MHASQQCFTPLKGFPNSMTISKTSLTEPRRFNVGRKLFKFSIVALTCALNALKLQSWAYDWTLAGSLHVGSNQDSVPLR